MKRFGKGIVAAVVVGILLMTLLPALADERSNGTEETPDAQGLSDRLVVTDEIVRGVVDSWEEFQTYVLKDYNSEEIPGSNAEVIYDSGAAPGTRKHPFLVLEIVPYMEYAEFGYLIDGCEPVDIDKIRRADVEERDHVLEILGGLGTVSIGTTTAYYFEGEEGYDYYITKVSTDGDGNVETNVDKYTGKVWGYFEKVEQGTVSGNGWTVSGNELVSGSEWIWHSYNLDEQEEKSKDDTIKFWEMDKVYEQLKSSSEIGTKVHAIRQADDTYNKCISVSNYRIYEGNNELFLTGLIKGEETEQKPEDYSVVVKTITPDQLNDQTDWIDYANLIYLSSANYNENLVEVWEKYGWLKDEGSQKGSQETEFRKNQYEINDLNWDAALRLFYKVMGMTEEQGKMVETDHAGLIIDDSIYNLSEENGFYTSSTSNGTVKSDVSIKVYNWNLGDTGETYSAVGSSNNIYKLAVMLQAMDSHLFRSLYLSTNGSSNAIIQADNDASVEGKVIGVNTWQTDTAKDFWSVQTFLLRNPYMTEAEYNNLLSDLDYWWKNYHSILDPTNKNYKYSVNEHVLICPGENGIVRGYSASMGEVAPDYKERFSDFTKYLEEERALSDSNPSPADAVRYILDDGIQEQSGSLKTIKVLDLEPSVKVVEGVPVAFLTESYVHMLAPFYRGEIEIVPRTMAEFIGMFEDLVSEYQMIYLGADTLWPGGSQDGPIYTASNDISERRVAELNDFLKAGHPMVAESYIYEPDKGKIETGSRICGFVETAKESDSEYPKMFFGIKEACIVSDAVLKIRKIADIEGPVRYDAASETQNKYLRFDDMGRPCMDFKITFTDAGDYGYRIYVDRDGDLDFEYSDDKYSELIEKDSVEVKGTVQKTITCTLPNKIGLVHWKIEVYDKKNRYKRQVLTGFSAVKSVSGEKEEIRVLQILDDELKDVLELSKWVAALKDYIADYSISAGDIMTRAEFEKIFAFEEDDEDEPTFKYDDTGLRGLEYLKTDLMKYDVIIVGLQNTQGGKLFKEQGAADFLQYWADMGRSIFYLNGLTPTDVSDESENNEIIQTVANDFTTTVSQLNQGLSVYPFKVDEKELKAGGTFAQNSNSPLKADAKGLTVWYCLAGGDYAWNDAMNNYYIYSNHNVFYSSIGYLEGTVTDNEKKLFINTIIASYNASDSGPMVKIEGSEAEPGLNLTYEIRGLVRGYDYDDEDGSFSPSGSIVGSDQNYPISFMLTESDPYLMLEGSDNAKLTYKCTIQYYDVDGSTLVGDVPRMHIEDDGEYLTVELKDGVYVFTGLKEGTTYILDSPNKYMDISPGKEYPRIKIRIENANSSRNYRETFTTVVNMSEQPLFPLE